METVKISFWRNGHILPFILWIAVIFILEALETFGICPRALYPWSYAVKSVVCLLLFCFYHPWRIYYPPTLIGLPLGILAGLLVAFLWILPESHWAMVHFPVAQQVYFKWFVMMPGSLPNYVDPAWWPRLPPNHLSMAYSVGEAGWGLTLAKLAGSGLVIATVEEFFFRGFLYRWLQDASFFRVPMNRFDWKAFLLVVLIFALEHDRWFVGLLAGLIYGLLALWTDDIWCCVLAHCTTNILLGLYVISERAYGFW